MMYYISVSFFMEICHIDNRFVTVSTDRNLLVIYLDCTVVDTTVGKWDIMSPQLK